MDTGNTFKLTGNQWPPSPYYRGRYSDGPLWVERLNISNLRNYAYAGAMMDSDFSIDNALGSNLTVPTVQQQINIYRNITDFRQVNFIRTLYAIWAGYFDYFDVDTINGSNIIDSLSQRIEDLIKIGAKKVLIVNEPSLRIYPYVYGVNETELIINDWTVNHNGNLSNLIQRFRTKYQNVSFYLLDAQKLINDIVKNSTAYGIHNLSNCWSPADDENMTLCENPSTYLFFDAYHFSSRVHQLLADRARVLLTSIGIVSCPLSSNYYLLIVMIILSKNFI